MSEDNEEDDDGIILPLERVVEKVLPEEPGYKSLKEEIWIDLSDIYYKYDSTHEQQKAFREVMYAISDKIQVGKWETVYHKLYRIEKEKKTI